MAKLTLAVDATLLNLMSCHYRWFLSYIKALRATGAPPDYIESGDLMHVMLKSHYRNWQLHIDERMKIATEKAWKRAKSLNLPDAVVSDDIAIYREYAKFYAGEPIVPILVEDYFAKILYEDDDIRIIFVGIVDLGVDNRGHKQVWDHKTSERASNPQPFNNQFVGYSWATGVDTIVVNTINMTPLFTPKLGKESSIQGDKRFKRFWFSYPDSVKERWRFNAARQVLRLVEACKDGYFEQDLTSCNKFNHPCIYQPLCMTEPELRGWRAQRDYVVAERWDPFKRDDEEEVVDGRQKLEETLTGTLGTLARLQESEFGEEG